MLIKRLRFILIFIFILSLIGAVCCAAEDIRVRDWYKTTLTVTFIGLPEGNVFGDYTDAKGVQHLNEPAFIKSSLSGYKTNAEQYYGSTFNILIEPETGLIRNYDELYRNSIFFSVLTVLSGALLFISRKYRKQDAEK